MLKIKDFVLKSNVIQSPMAGCTDLAYRLLSRKYGMEFAFLEMVAAESLIRGNEATNELMKTVPEDKPLGAQIVGCRAEAMGQAAEIIEGLGYDLLDLNLGCPVPKIAGKGAGSALLGRPDEAKEIFKAVVRSIKKIPVTVKMRIGVADASGAEAVRIAKIAEDCGINALSVHGRTRIQGYSGKADYEAIGRVKQAVKIPVIGNGDVLSGDDAKRLIEVAGVDGVMIGRGGLGNPWIFKNIEKTLSGENASLETPSLEDRKQALLKHLDLELENRAEHSVVCQMRKIACWYFAGTPGVVEFRGKINTSKSALEVRYLIEGFGVSLSSN